MSLPHCAMCHPHFISPRCRLSSKNKRLSATGSSERWPQGALICVTPGHIPSFSLLSDLSCLLQGW